MILIDVRFSFQIKNVRDHRKENRMESFFLAETTKYLYMLFDPDNFLNNDGSGGTVIQMLNGECVIDTGSYIFNTEAHPIDSAALRCCHEMPYTELITENFAPSNYLGETMELKIDDKTIPDIYRLDEFATNQEDSKEFGYKVTEWLTETDDDKSELLKFIDEIKAMSGKTSSQKNPLLANLTDSNGSTIASTQQQQEQQASSDMTYDDLILFDEILAAEVNKTATNFQNQTTDVLQKSRTAKIITQTTTSSYSSSPSPSSSSQTSSQSWQETANANDDDEKSKLADDVIRPIPSVEPVVQRRVFDAQKLLEQIRKVNDGVHVVPNYEMLTCKSQSFLQRLAVLGEMLT